MPAPSQQANVASSARPQWVFVRLPAMGINARPINVQGITSVSDLVTAVGREFLLSKPQVLQLELRVASREGRRPSDDSLADLFADPTRVVDVFSPFPNERLGLVVGAYLIGQILPRPFELAGTESYGAVTGPGTATQPPLPSGDGQRSHQDGNRFGRAILVSLGVYLRRLASVVAPDTDTKGEKSE